MNPFTTVPKFIEGYIETKRYTSLIPEMNELRRQGRLADEKELIRKGQKRWVEGVADKLKMSFEVSGMENFPTEEPFMIYSNHQGYADIAAICWICKDHCQMGFVAKEEWRKVRTLQEAISYTRSIFLERGGGREAVKSINDAKDVLGMGFNLTVFPEGTRSQGHEMGEFKQGAFKFAEKGNVPILPVTIDGSYKFFEEQGTWQPSNIKITVHPLVHIEKMAKHEQKEAAIEIERTIQSALV